MVQLMLLLSLLSLLQVVWTTLTVGSSLTVALAVPDQAEKIYAVVGASAVCVVCYVIPVYIQLQMYHRSKQQQKLQVRALAGQQLVCDAAVA
jgi:ABC-type arginine/histidine transport system permease subunit